MKPVVVRNITIGEGRPKICVPIVARDGDSILQQAREIRTLPVDVVEWRADWYGKISCIEETVTMAGKLREVLGEEIPLLFTVRTARDGGEKEISPAEYTAVNEAAAASSYVDLVDVELSAGETAVRQIMDKARSFHVKVIVSSHDFDRTPPEEELVHRMMRMQELGADIAKIAVMPRSREDVLTLLAATACMAGNHARIPLITMSMSGTGVISRLAGETFGSAMTFGAAAQASAPGQIGVRELKTVLDILHSSQCG